MATTLLAAFDGPEGSGVRVEVAAITRGYSVVVRDTDCGEVLPTAIVYPTETAALAAAAAIAKNS